VYADKWAVPRYGPRAFYIALNECMKDYYGYELDVLIYGKPEITQFKYAESLIRQNLET
jgi:hypothetical protein